MPLSCSPYVDWEARVVALAAALRPFGPISLADPFARRAAFTRAGLGRVSGREDRAACRRAELRLQLFAPSQGSAP